MIRGILSVAFALLVWGVTFANTRALLMDFSALEIMVARFALACGSFSINLDWDENIARFGQTMNWINLIFLGVLASGLSFIAWSKACAVLGVVHTTICLYLEPIIGVGFAAPSRASDIASSSLRMSSTRSASARASRNTTASIASLQWDVATSSPPASKTPNPW